MWDGNNKMPAVILLVQVPLSENQCGMETLRAEIKGLIEEKLSENQCGMETQ